MTVEPSAGQRKETTASLWFLRFFPSRWTSATRGWQPAEKGIWIDLFVMMHERGEPVPEDCRRLARACGTTEAHFKRTLRMLIEAGIVVRRPSGLWSLDVEAEVDHRKDRSEKARENSSERWKKSKQKQGPIDADAYLNREIEIDVSEDRSSSGHSSTGGQRSTAEVGDDARLAGASSSRGNLFSVGDQIFIPGYGDCLVHDVLDGRGIVVARIARSRVLIWTGMVDGKLAYICDAPVEPPRPAATLVKRRASA